MDFEAIYKVGTLAIIGVGWIGGAIWLSVEYHLDQQLDLTGWIPGIVILPLVASVAWPAAPLIGLGYLAHKGIGRIVKFSQRSKLSPQWPDNLYADPDLIDAEREVEEICNEAH